MISATLAPNIVGIIGNIISFGLFFSPIPTFYQIIKNKSVEEFKPDQYIATLLNCTFLVFYGLPFVHPHSLLVLTINNVGLVFEFIYLTIFYIYATNKGRKKVLLWLVAEIVFMASIAVTALLALHGTRQRSLVVGILCDFFNAMMYVSPLTIIHANFANGVCWRTYALICPFDIYVLISNGLGAISGLIQLTVYAYYCSCKRKNDDDDNDGDDV